MNQRFNSKSAFLLNAILIGSAGNATERIKSIQADKGKIERVYMTPGLASVITFPCDIDEAIVGRDQDLKALVSPTTKRQLTLYLNSSSSQPTNLLVRCGSKRDLFVFDIISSRSSHQDELKVQSTFGAPSLDQKSEMRIVDSSTKRGRQNETASKPKIVEVLSPKLLEEKK